MNDDPRIPEDLITTAHAARIARLHIAGIRRWIKSGRLPGYRIGGRWWVSRAELMELWRTAGQLMAERNPGIVLPSTRREQRAQYRASMDKLRELGVKV
jgi:excisionase family DNA binding protein